MRNGLLSSDRQRLLAFSVVVLAAVGVACAVCGIWSVRVFAPLHGPPAPATGAVPHRDLRILLVALSFTAVLVIGGATLLLRVTAPFVRKLEESVAALAKTKRLLEARTADLDRSYRELDDFTYIAAHDLKEPLRGMVIYAQLLREDFAPRLGDEGAARLEALERLGQRLAQLIDDLLAFARAGRSPVVERPTDAEQALDEVLATLEPVLAQRRAVVERTARLPRVMLDATLMGEVLRNLIINAVKFNDSPQPRIEIGVQGETSTIYVRDNGIGIPSEFHGAVFTMFRRLHPRARYPGTGAGLGIVRRIVEAVGGRIWVESAPGLGSTFLVSLPLAASPPPVAASPRPTIKPHRRAGAPRRPLRVAGGPAAALPEGSLPPGGSSAGWRSEERQA